MIILGAILLVIGALMAIVGGIAEEGEVVLAGLGLYLVGVIINVFS